MNQPNEGMIERFDDKFPKNRMGGIEYTYRDGGVKDRENLIKFLESEIDLALAKQRGEYSVCENKMRDLIIDFDDNITEFGKGTNWGIQKCIDIISTITKDTKE